MNHKISNISDWRDGFRSGSKLANDGIKDLLGKAIFDETRLLWLIPEESIELVRQNLAQGYGTAMRVSSPAGLDFYMAMSSTQRTQPFNAEEPHVQ